MYPPGFSSASGVGVGEDPRYGNESTSGDGGSGSGAGAGYKGAPPGYQSVYELTLDEMHRIGFKGFYKD